MGLNSCTPLVTAALTAIFCLAAQQIKYNNQPSFFFFGLLVIDREGRACWPVIQWFDHLLGLCSRYIVVQASWALVPIWKQNHKDSMSMSLCKNRARTHTHISSLLMFNFMGATVWLNYVNCKINISWNISIGQTYQECSLTFSCKWKHFLF